MTAGEWREGGETLEFEGHRLFSRRAGQGGALLLIHGFPTSSLDWARLWPALAQRRALHAIDMLGFGLSDKPADFHYSVAASADQWQVLAQARGLAEVDLLAHDYGDTVAQELLARQLEGRLPFRIRSVAFLNGGLFPEASFPLPLQRLLAGPLGPLAARFTSERAFVASMRRVCAQPPEAEELHAHWLLLARAEGKRVLPKLLGYIRERTRHRERWVDALVRAQVPLCLVDGLQDPVSGASIVRRWRELLPQARVVELEGVGHYPQWEAPQRVLAALESFLSK